MDGGPGHLDSGMSEDLRDRWANLLEAIRQQCRDHSQDPGLMEADESTFKVSLPLGGRAHHAIWFTEEQVVRDDPGALAAFVYREYREESSQGQAPPDAEEAPRAPA